MTKHGKRDLLIHYDEESNELIFYTVAVDDTKQIRSKEFDGARMDIPLFLEMSADEAEKTLGGTVFSMIEMSSTRKTGIRPYEELAQERHKKDVAEWETEAGEGDPEAQYMLFIEYHSRALFQADGFALERAEEMLNLSVAQGYPEAIRAKESWPRARAAVERKLRRGPAA